jgi:uncharacterized protein (TIGR02217 family)
VTIADYRLPDNIESGSGFGPSWNNIEQEAIAGNEQRFARWTKCRGVGDLSLGLQDSDDPLGDFRAIYAMFLSHRGSLYPWRFRCHYDCTAENESFGTGAGVETVFQLTMTYDPSEILLGIPGPLSYVRDITLVVGTPILKINGTPTSAFTLSSAGVVTFTSAPTGDLTWSGTFDIPVRFDTQSLPVIMNAGNLAGIRSIPIKEVIGES